MRRSLAGALLILGACFVQALAAEPPHAFRDPALDVRELAVAVEVSSGDAVRAKALGSGAVAFVDPRTGRFATLAPGTLLLHGRREGKAAWEALRAWMRDHAATLRIDVDELGEPMVNVVAPDLIQIVVPRVVDGVPVRDAALTATFSHGRLTLLGFRTWADAPPPASARIDAHAAEAALARRYGAVAARAAPRLEWFPEVDRGVLGYRLAWSHAIEIGVDAPYEALVDAARGEVIALRALDEHVATPRTVGGGVLPLSNDGALPDGVEQADWPMPFAVVATPDGELTTDAGGRVPACVDGVASASLSGPYATIVDGCGATSLSGSGDLDFGVSGGTDCATPGSGGPGNTRAARTAFYEVNRSNAAARALLPQVAWLRTPVTIATNTVGSCNARWVPPSILTYRSGSGCRNTGEIASIVAHEWAHALDNNLLNTSVTQPAEAFADAFASLRTNSSCIGRGFVSQNCSGDVGANYACTDCTGVRDIDFAKHATPQPFTIASIANCPAVGDRGPCQRLQQCESQVVSQAIWDLWNRDLAASMPLDTARELASQLLLHGSGPVSSWYQCNPQSMTGDGCAASGGYLNLLAADDDNGNIADGTPHMAAIHAAFARHGIACPTPAVASSGCAGTPTVAPVVTASPRDGAVALSWTAVPSAQGYRVYRTDGVRGCAYGKELVATTSATSFFDTGLRNGRPYSYHVVPTGASATCFGPGSACAQATPVPGANTTLVAGESTIVPITGDGDGFLEDCEVTDYRIPFENIGTAAATNVRITAVSSPSHPQTQLLTTVPLTVAASQASCATNEASLRFRPSGLGTGVPFQLAVTWTSDDLAGILRTTTLSFDQTQRGPGDPQAPNLPAGTGPCGTPVLQAAGSPLAFDPQRWNGGSQQTLHVVLTNVGSDTIAAANLGAVLVTGTAFSLGAPVGMPIAPGETATLPVTFDPSSAGAFSDRLHLSLDHDDPARPDISVLLAGTGTQSLQTFTPAPIDVGSAAVGATVSAPVDLGNAGTAVLNLAGAPAAMTFEGGAAGDFRFGSLGCEGQGSCNPAPSAIAPGGSVQLVLRCTPSVSGTRATSLVVRSDDPASPRTLAVTCTGTSPPPDFVFAHGFEG